jgi:hypothetical protein
MESGGCGTAGGGAGERAPIGSWAVGNDRSGVVERNGFNASFSRASDGSAGGEKYREYFYKANSDVGKGSRLNSCLRGNSTCLVSALLTCDILCRQNNNIASILAHMTPISDRLAQV